MFNTSSQLLVYIFKKLRGQKTAQQGLNSDLKAKVFGRDLIIS